MQSLLSKQTIRMDSFNRIYYTFLHPKPLYAPVSTPTCEYKVKRFIASDTVCTLYLKLCVTQITKSCSAQICAEYSRTFLHQNEHQGLGLFQPAGDTFQPAGDTYL